MRVGVFGGAGFLGSHVADELSNCGHEVRIFDQHKSVYLRDDQSQYVGDILDKADIKAFIEGCDAVYNFAGLADLNVSRFEPEKTLQLNVMGNLNILEACKNNKQVKRVIFASSAYVFSDKGSFYGVSKRCAEQLIEEYYREYGLNYSIIRYGSVYGPRADKQNRVYRIVEQALRDGVIEFKGDGSEEREYIHVKDAAKLSVDVLHNEGFINQHLILTGVERFKYKELLSMIKEMLNDKIELRMLNQEYKGHYQLTPYTFNPSAGKKLVSNHFVDIGQGLLEVMDDVYTNINQQDS